MYSGEWSLAETPGPLAAHPMRLTLIFVGVVAVGLLVGWVVRSQPTEIAEVGRPAPDFEVELLDGGTFRLSDHLASTDGPTVLNLWASWCIPCRTEMPDLDQFASDNPTVTVIGVAVDDTEQAARAFADEVGVSYRLALGNPDFEAAYPKFGLPVTWVISPDGVITALHNGIATIVDLEGLITR